MIALRYGVAGLVIFLTVSVAVMNWRRLLRPRHSRWGQEAGTIPLLSIALTAVAAYLYPGSPKLWLLCLPLVDVATWVVIILPFWLMLKAFVPGLRQGNCETEKERPGTTLR